MGVFSALGYEYVCSGLYSGVIPASGRPNHLIPHTYVPCVCVMRENENTKPPGFPKQDRISGTANPSPAMPTLQTVAAYISILFSRRSIANVQRVIGLWGDATLLRSFLSFSHFSQTFAAQSKVLPMHVDGTGCPNPA